MKNLTMLALLLTVFSGTVAAHTALSESSPAEGAVLDKAPETLTLNFTESVRLLRAEVMILKGGESQKIDTGFQAQSSSSQQHTVSLPALNNGRYTVEWAVLGADAHPVEGTLTFSVGMTGTQSENREAEGHHNQSDNTAASNHGAH
ncbi:MAG: copper resistance CopC family protein [Pseudohongiellaceae bacterium]